MDRYWRKASWRGGLKMRQALKVDVQQSTPALQGDTWVPQSNVRPKHLGHQINVGTGFRDLGDSSCFSFTEEHGASQAHLACWQRMEVTAGSKNTIPSTAFCSDPLLCTGKCVAHSICSSPSLAKEGQWHLVWNTKLVKRWPFSPFPLCLPWRMIILYIHSACSQVHGTKCNQFQNWLWFQIPHLL